MCDICGEFFHYECIKLTYEDVAKMEAYRCTKCENEGRSEAFYEGTTIECHVQCHVLINIV